MNCAFVAGATVDQTPWQVEALASMWRQHCPTHIVCLIGTTKKRGRTASTIENYETVDYGLTKLLLDAAQAAGIRPFFIYLSAVGVGPAAPTAYMQWRHRAEEAVRQSGLVYLIARPSFITGTDREEPRPVERIAAQISDGALKLAGLIGGGRLCRRYLSISGQALAEGLVTHALQLASQSGVLEREDLA